MSAEQHPAAALGIRMTVVAAVVALLVLILQGPAAAAEPDELATMLVEAQPPTDQERYEQAEATLRSVRNERLLRLHEHVFDSGWRLWTGTSPSRLLSSMRHTAKELASWRRRSVAEDEALEWLEVSMEAGVPDDRSVSLYTWLRDRERAQQLEIKLAGAESAIADGHPLLAKVRLARSLELGSSSERTLELRAKLDTTASATPLWLADSTLTVDPWEAPVAAALLTGDYRTAMELSPDAPSGMFARAVAQFLGGSKEEAFEELDELGDRDGLCGALARGWTDLEEINVEESLDREERQYQVQRVLGFVGGRQLASRGVELSPVGYQAWRESITPLNMAVAMPARVYSGWKPDGDALREAALRYIAELPEGARSEDAAAWVQSIDPAQKSDLRAWSGDSFALPDASIKFSRITPPPVVLTRRVLDSVHLSDVPAIRAALGDGAAVVLQARRHYDPADAIQPDLARRFVTELAFAIEDGQLEPVSRGNVATLDAVRRLESALRDGSALVVEPADPGDPKLWGNLSRALVDGGYQQVGMLGFARGDDEVRVVREFGRSAFACPDLTACIDRPRWLSGHFFGDAEASSRIHFGFHTSVRDAHFEVSFQESGPAASLVIPVARWIGVERWLPFAAYVGVSPDSLYVGPAFDRH